MALESTSSNLQVNSAIGTLAALRRIPGDLAPELVLGNPSRYWHLFLDRLQGQHFGIGARFSSTQLEIGLHTVLLKDISRRDPEAVGKFMQAGQENILQALEKTNDPVKMQLLRNLFIQLETGTVQQDIPGFANIVEVPELIHGREYLENEAVRNSAAYIQSTFRHLAHPKYGVGKPADLSDVMIQRHKRIMDRAHQKMGADWHHTFFSLSKARISTFLQTVTDQSVTKAIETTFKETLEKSVEGYAAYTAHAVGNEEIAGNYYEGFARDLADSTIGVGAQKADLSDIFVAAHERVLEKLAAKDESVQRAYVKAAIDKGVEFIKERGRARPDVSARVFKDLIRLVSDSPIAQAMQKREKAGLGGREQTTLEPLQRYFIYKVIGQEFSYPGGSQPYLQTGKSGLDGTLLKHLGDFIATKDETRTPEQIKLNQFALIALREHLAQAKDEKALKSLLISFIASTETLSARLERDVNEGSLFDWLASLKLLSPQTLTEVALTMGESGPLEKTHRFHPQRMQASSTPERTQTEKLGPFYAAFDAGGKLISKHLPHFPPDINLVTIFSGALPGRTISSFVARNDKLTGLGDSPPGPLYALNDGEHIEDAHIKTQWNSTRSDMFGKFTQQAIGEGGRIVRFAKGDQIHQEFAALELYTMGLMLKDNKGEDNALKDTVRNQYLDLLVDVVTDVSSQRYGEPVRTAGLKVIERCLPYWPLEDQKKFVDKIATRAVLTDSAILENGHYKKILFPLAVRFNHHLPSVEGESQNVRPIAEHIMDKTLWVLEGFPTVDGRSRRRSVFATVLGFSPDELTQEQSRKSLIERLKSQQTASTRGTFPFQAIDMVAPFGTADQKTKLVNILTQLAQADLLVLAPFAHAPPRTSREFVQAAEQLHGRVLGALGKASDIFTQTVSAIAGVDEGIIVADDGSISFPNAPSHLEPLIQKVATVAQKELERLKQETGLADTEARAKETVGHITNSDGQLVEKVLKQLRSAIRIPSDSKTQLEMEPVLETLRARIGTPPNTSTETIATVPPAQTIPAEFLALHLAGYLMQSGLIQITDHNSASKALATIVETVLNDRQLSRQLTVDLMQKTGLFKNFEMTAELEQTALSAIGNQLTNQAARQNVVTTLMQNLERVRADVAQQGIALQTALAKVGTEVASGVLAEHQANVAHLIHTRLATKQARLAQAEKALQAYNATMTQLASDATQVATGTLGRIVHTAKDMHDWLNEISGSDGVLAQLAALLETNIATTGVNVLVPLPTPGEILGRRGDAESLKTKTQTLPAP